MNMSSMCHFFWCFLIARAVQSLRMQPTPFSPRESRSHPTAFDPDPPFLGVVPPHRCGGERRRLNSTMNSWLLVNGGDSTTRVLGRLGVALARREAIDVKEYFEACEFYLRTRKRLRSPVVFDLACGHGLVGLLFAAFEKTVDKVILVDSRKPASFDLVLEAFKEVAPWVTEKNVYLEADIGSDIVKQEISRWCSFAESRSCVSIHACGKMTDLVLEVACSIGASVAVMPCCYTGTSTGVPYGLRRAFGVSMAADIDRSYRLHAQGYHIDFTAIPKEVTPMNRIIVAEPPTNTQRGAPDSLVI